MEFQWSLFRSTLQLLSDPLDVPPPLQSYGQVLWVLVALAAVYASDAACGFSSAFSMAVPYGRDRLKKPNCKTTFELKHFEETKSIFDCAITALSAAESAAHSPCIGRR